MNAPVEQFRDAIRSAGLGPPEAIEPDGKIHRFPTNGKRNDDSGWYVFHGDSIAAGAFGDWRTDLSQTWRADVGRAVTPTEEAAYRAKVEAMRLQREADEAQAHERAASNAAAIVRASKPAPADHPYLARKGIKPNGAKVLDGFLVIPMRDAGGKLWNVERIAPTKPADGADKKGLYEGRRLGCYFSIGTLKGASALCIAEGFATGATIHEATGLPVAVAFNAANLELVARDVHAKLPELALILCADDDVATKGNPGLTNAMAAARAVGGRLAIPDFGSNRPDGATDFNDMAAHRGLEAVGRAIASAAAQLGADLQASEENGMAGDSDGWPEPLPLLSKVAIEPYPLDALPDTIRRAVEEVHAFTKAPIPLVASSALAALSLATQAYADVQRAEMLVGPTSLFLLTIADSGERKSTCDGFFTKAIRAYEQQQAEDAKPIQAEHRAALTAWEAKQGGIKDKIRQLAKEKKPTVEYEAMLRELERDKPETPRVPRLIYGDATPEALKWNLAKQWPSGGVISAEGGIVFGAHGMNKESIMRNLATLNELWDAKPISTERRTSESFIVRGARLTMALQVQEATLRSFFDKSGGLARGSGFLARFLVAWPGSTQGTRAFTEPPSSWPALSAFNRRVAEILDQPAPIDDEGALTPPVLQLAPDAKIAWVVYHDAIENELRTGGELYDVRDVASKSADNAVRLAALFQVFEHGMGGAIGLEVFEGASRIAAWHLNESRRFFGELALPVELADAVRLDSWLIEHCERDQKHLVGKNYVRQNGPLRDGDRLDAAIRELAELDRVRLEKNGKRLTIHLNPALAGKGG